MAAESDICDFSATEGDAKDVACRLQMKFVTNVAVEDVILWLMRPLKMTFVTSVITKDDSCDLYGYQRWHLWLIWLSKMIFVT